MNAWKEITTNNFVLRIVSEGYKFQFSASPALLPPVISAPKSPDQIKALQLEIVRLLDSGAISPISPSDDQFCSRVFCVKKANGKDRMIIDLSRLNRQILKVHFKMENLDTIKALLAPGDYMASIDLADAFLSIRIHDSCRKFTVFEFLGIRYAFNSLPFGFTSSPRIFSKVLKPAIVFLRSRGLKISSYLDDIFICASSPILLNSHVSTCLNLLLSLGFVPNYEKSHLSPSQTLNHLGFSWDSVHMTVSVPPDKILRARTLAAGLLNSPASLRAGASLLGFLVSLGNAFSHAPLFYRGLQRCLISSLRTHSWDSPFLASALALSDLRWWASCPDILAPVSLRPLTATVTLATDASSTGWGAVFSSEEGKTRTVSGSWSADEALLHINLLELKAIHLSLMSFLPSLAHTTVHIFSDNSTAVHYLQNRGGTRSFPMCRLALQLWHFLLENDIQALVSHICGTDNVVADHFSRMHADPTDFALSQLTFDYLSRQFHVFPSIDLFASRLTNKLPCFVSWKLDPLAWTCDAFSFSWSDSVYLFPPVSLLTRVLQKFTIDGVHDSILITPAWAGLPALHHIVDLLFSDPISLPAQCVHHFRLPRRPFSWMAWPITTNVAGRGDYLRIRRLRSQRASHPAHSPHIYGPGGSLLVGLRQRGIRPLSPSL